MKRDEVLKVFPDATSEQVDAILNGGWSDINSLKNELKTANEAVSEGKALLAKLEKDNASYKEEIGALKAQIAAGMSTEEQLEAMKNAYEAEKREFKIKANTLDAREIFLKAGLSKEDCESLLEQVVSDDSDKTKALAEGFVTVFKAQAELIEQKTKDELLKSNPKINDIPETNASLTKEQFDKLSYAEKSKLLEENPDLLKGFESRPILM